MHRAIEDINGREMISYCYSHAQNTPIQLHHNSALILKENNCDEYLNVAEYTRLKSYKQKLDINTNTSTLQRYRYNNDQLLQ